MEESQGINQNESTSEIQEPIQKVGGESASSFDELEALHDRAKDVSAKPAKEEKPSQKVEAKKDEKATEEASGTDDEAEEEVKEESKEEPKKEAKKEEKVPTYKVKQGDQELALRDDALVKIKVNDKLVEIPFKEIRENYAGKVAWDKKFTEVDVMKKEVTKQATLLSESLTELNKTAQTDPYGAFLKTLEYAGLDVNQTQTKFLAQVLEAVEKLQKMTPEEKIIYEKDLEAQKYKSKAEAYESREAAQRKAQQEEEVLKQHLASYSADMKLDETQAKKDFVQAHDELVQMQRENKIPGDKEITSKLVADFAINKRLYSAVESFLSEIDESLVENDEAVEELAQVFKTQKGLSLEDLKDIAIEVYGTPKAKTLNRKLKKAVPRDTSKPQAKSPTNLSSDPINFDSL